MKEDARNRKTRLEQAEDFIDALRGGEVDAVVGKENVLLLRLQEVEEALQRSESRYRHIVDTQTEMICRRRADAVVTYANPAYCRFVGTPLESLRDSAFMPPFHPEDRAAVQEAIASLTPARPLAEIDCRITATDSRLRWTRWHIQGFFDDGGVLAETQAIGRDITDEKRAVRELELAQLALAARNEQLDAAYQELQEYSEAVVHDIGAVLRAVSNYSRFLQEDLAPSLDGEKRECLENLARVAATGGTLLRELKKLAGIGRHTEAPVSVDFEAMMADLAAMLGPESTVDLVFPSTWPELEAPPSLVRMILGNLIANAAKFNQSAEKRVEVGWRAGAPERVEFYVRDNGIGIDPRFHDRIFRLFKRLHTDREYSGSGMGLAVVSKAVRLLGGSLRVESEPGRGSTFFVDLPLR